MKIKRGNPQDRIILVGSTRDGRNATYPRGKVYSIDGISPCVIGCAIHTGSGNEPRILIEYEDREKHIGNSPRAV